MPICEGPRKARLEDILRALAVRNFSQISPKELAK